MESNARKPVPPYTAIERHREVFDTSDPNLEAHAPTSRPAPVDRLRASISRSIAQHLAVDQTTSALVPIEAVRAERDRLREQLRVQPLDHSAGLRRLQDQIKSTGDHSSTPCGANTKRNDNLTSSAP